MQNRIKNKYILVSSVLLLVTLINYWRVPFLFWQQDEWVTFSNLIQYGINIIWHGLEIKSTHFSPISNFLSFICYKVFGFNYSGYLILGLLIHLINGALIFKIAEKIIHNFFYSLLAAILFIGSSSSYQLLMWPVINLNSISLTFTLLASTILINFIINKNQPFLLGVLVAFFSALSLFTIEYSAGIFIFIPITTLIFYKRVGKIKGLYFLSPLFLFIIFYFLFRFYYTTPLNIVLTSSQANQNSVIHNGLSYPFYYLGQVYTPENLIVQISKKIAKVTNTSETLYFFKISFVFSIFIIFLTGYTVKKASLEKYPNVYKVIFSLLLFIFSSSMPFVLLSGESGNFSIFPSRYLYFGTAGGSLLLAILLYYAKAGKAIYIFKAIAIIIVGFILLSTYQNLQTSKTLYDQGQMRKSILETIKSKYPYLPHKTVFYIQSDRSYYGLPVSDKIPPFQAGLGQILLIWYSDKIIFPVKFYQAQYLWGITDENYMEVEGFGYGYFRNFDKLQQAVYSYNLPPNSVIAFSWDGERKHLTDITPEIRKALSLYSSDNLTK